MAHDTVSQCFAVSVIGMLTLRENKGVFEEDVSFKSGKVTFQYLRNIGVPVMAARINRQEKNIRNSLAFLSVKYATAIAKLYEGTSTESFEDVWKLTGETE